MMLAEVSGAVKSVPIAIGHCERPVHDTSAELNGDCSGGRWKRRGRRGGRGGGGGHQQLDGRKVSLGH